MIPRYDGADRDSGGRRFGKRPFRGGGGSGESRGRGSRPGDRRGPPRFKPQRDDRRFEQPPRTQPEKADLPFAETARQVAFVTLLEAVSSPEYVTDHLEQVFADSDLSPQERRQAMDLAFGVVRRKATIDAVLEKAVTRPKQDVERDLWMLLRLGAYQLALCDGIPDHAACDETVKLAKWLGRREWVGFVNGVLRGIARSLSADAVDGPATNNIPLSAGRFRRILVEVFPDPATKPVAHIARAFSFPTWLVERWAARFDFSELIRLGFWFNTPTSLCLRVNRLRTNRDQLLAKLTDAGIAARPGEQPMSIWLANQPSESTNTSVNPSETPASESSHDAEHSQGAEQLENDASDDVDAVGQDLDESDDSEELTESATAPAESNESGLRIDRLPGFAEGWFVVQDESAQRAAELLAPQPGETVLDLCSAPGTKSTHLAELMNNEGRIIATDTSETRLARVRDNCDRLGITIVETAVVSNEGENIPDGPFDAILIDAPCSNTGVLGKRPDARWRLRPDDLEELSRIQLRLLLAAADRLRPGGRLVYSTCSIEPEENRQVVEAAVHFRSFLQVVESHELTPGQPGDGGFQCLLRRAESPSSK